MAMLDYGALVFVDGNLVNSSRLFMDMAASVGWDDDAWNPEGTTLDRIKGNFFAYCGDAHFTAAFYKRRARFIIDQKTDRQSVVDVENAGDADAYAYDRRERRVMRSVIGGVSVTIRALRYTRDVYRCSFYYRGRHCVVVYGYGVDADRNVWNHTKRRYMPSRVWRQIDRMLERAARMQKSTTEEIE